MSFKNVDVWEMPHAEEHEGEVSKAESPKDEVEQIVDNLEAIAHHGRLYNPRNSWIEL